MLCIKPHPHWVNNYDILNIYKVEIQLTIGLLHITEPPPDEAHLHLLSKEGSR